MSSQKPILIVDDDFAVQADVGGALELAGYQTREATGGKAAIEAACRERPWLVILETRLPDVCGYEVCRELRSRFGEALPILFISADRTEASDRVAGLLIGGDDYLVKPFALDELLARVRALIRRAAATDPAVARDLTDRELEVLRLIADGLHQAEIATRLFVSPKTIGTHIEHIFTKLGVHSRAQAVAAAYRYQLLAVSVFATSVAPI